MINPLIPVSIPILHRVLYRWIYRFELNYLFPLMYTAYVIYLTMKTGYELFGYSLSTIPIMGDLHAPIILVIDPHTLVFLYINSFIYFMLVKYSLRESSRLLLLISVLTLTCFSLDLLLCLVLLSILYIYIVLLSNNSSLVNYYLLSIILFTIGFLFTNTYNISLIVVYTKFSSIYGVNENLLGIGLYIYILVFLTQVFISINFYPFVEKTSFEKWSNLFLLLYSISIVMRLKPILDTLYIELYSVYAYSLILLSLINMLNHSILYLKTRIEEYVNHYELSYIPLTLVLNTSFTYPVIIYTLVTHIIHRFIKQSGNNYEYTTMLSQIGLPPLIGGLARILFFILVIRYVGLLLTIIPLITYMYMLISCLTIIKENIFYKPLFYYHIVSNIVLLILLIYIEPIGSILYRFPDFYYRIVFGV